MKKQNRDWKKNKNTKSNAKAASLKKNEKQNSDEKLDIKTCFSTKKRTLVKRRKLSDIFAALDNAQTAAASDLPPKTDTKDQPRRRRGRPTKSAAGPQLQPPLSLPAKSPNYKGKQVANDAAGHHGFDEGNISSSDDEYYLRDFDIETNKLLPPLPKGGGELGQPPPSSAVVIHDPSEVRLQECAEALYGKEFFMNKEPPVVGLHTAMMVIAQSPHFQEALTALMNATPTLSAPPQPSEPLPRPFTVSGQVLRPDQIQERVQDTPADANAMLPHHHQVPPQMVMPIAALPPQMMVFGSSNFPGMYLQGDPGASSSRDAFMSGNSGNPGASPSGGV